MAAGEAGRPNPKKAEGSTDLRCGGSGERGVRSSQFFICEATGDWVCVATAIGSSRWGVDQYLITTRIIRTMNILQGSVGINTSDNAGRNIVILGLCGVCG
jgi:hypothetical protein